MEPFGGSFHAYKRDLEAFPEVLSAKLQNKDINKNTFTMTNTDG